jgi:sugar/nucleoside kinase (ribokinase family)
VSILVVGSVGLDTITTPHGKVEDVLGGSAAHFSLAASFYTKVHLVGVVGTDFPQDQLGIYRERGVDLSGLQSSPGATFRWAGYYTVDFHKAHTLDTQLNVFSDFHPRLSEDHRKAECVFLANIAPELQLEVLDQVKNPKWVAGDTMNLWIETKRDQVLEVMKRIDLLIINDGEARELCETHNLVSAGKALLKMGPKYVVIKKGEHGAALFYGAEVFYVPAYPLTELADPTGAGDSFAGGLLGHLSRSGELTEGALRQALVYGSIMGSYCVEDFSTRRISRLTSAEIEQRYIQFQRMASF